MYHTILVPFDGSDFGVQALDLAAEVGRRADASLLLLHVAGAIPAAEPGEAPEALVEADRRRRERRKADLDAAAERLEAGGVSVTPRLETGRISDVLVETAEAEADLVVMATHGRGPLSRFWLGSVADALVRRCAVPLLLVRPREDGEGVGPDDLEHLLLPLDGSELAETVLAPAAALGDLFAARYTLLRVVRPVFPGVAGYEDAAPVIDPTVVEDLEAAAADYLGELRERLPDAMREVDTRVVRGSSIPSAVLEAAREAGGSAIALASHGRGGIERALLGSTADKIVRGARGPVLVHRPAAARRGDGEDAGA